MKQMKFISTRGFKVGVGNRRSQAASMVLAPGQAEGGEDNHHRGADQWLLVLSGTGEAKINGRTVKLRAKSCVLIERGDRHQICNTGRTPLVTCNIYVPPAYRSDGNELPAGRKKRGGSQ